MREGERLPLEISDQGGVEIRPLLARSSGGGWETDEEKSSEGQIKKHVTPKVISPKVKRKIRAR